MEIKITSRKRLEEYWIINRYLKLKKDFVRILLWTIQFFPALPENPKTPPPSNIFQRYGRTLEELEIEQLCDTLW